MLVLKLAIRVCYILGLYSLQLLTGQVVEQMVSFYDYETLEIMQAIYVDVPLSIYKLKIIIKEIIYYLRKLGNKSC